MELDKEIALKLAKEGYSLYLHYQSKYPFNSRIAKHLLSVYNGEYIPIQADLSTRDGYKKLVDNIFSLDAIVHNSGNSHYGLFVDID